MAHPYHMHREQQVAHRRVAPLLKGQASGATSAASSKPFSAVTSKSAASDHDDISGGAGARRYARGGKVKGKKGHQTNIAIVVPHSSASAVPPAEPTAGPAGGPPMAGPGLPPGGGPPPGMPPGMPMRARGGKIAGEDTKANNKAWGKRAAANSYFTGGAATGVGREEKAAHKRKGR